MQKFHSLFFILSTLLPGCPEPPAGNDDDNDATEYEPFTLDVDVRRWSGNVEGASVCDSEPTLEYVYIAGVHYGEIVNVTQNQSWPIYLSWSADVPLDVPALGISESNSGAVYFNPWQNMDVAFCNGSDCSSVLSIAITQLPERSDCIWQPIVGMYTDNASWMQSNGECYGVSNVDSHYSSHWSCTDWAPPWACPSNDNPSADCGAYGCQCNLSAWSRVAANEVRYDASVTSAAGVTAPWFADRWETGGMHGANDGNTVFRQYAEVRLSEEALTFRQVIDMRLNWNGSWGSIPAPDGWEGPPIFRNAVNDYIAPADGYFPVEWEAAPTSAQSDVWMQPIWSTTVHPGGEAGTTSLRNLAFKACGPAVSQITCTGAGCSY